MNKRFHDWYKIQKDVQGWENIPADQILAERLAPLDLLINFDYSHYAIQNLLGQFRCSGDQAPDFYVITELDLGKRPLDQLFELYRECYQHSRVGIYFAVLSYYLEPKTIYPHLTGPYSKNIDIVFRENLSYADRIENVSTVIDYPLIQAEKDGYLTEGSNFIFVHPNIKYFLWKD